jgi:hypothetical protein
MANPSAKVSNPQAADAAAKANGALWYAFQGVGRAYLIKPGTSASSDAAVSGMHGYSTIEAAVANPNGANAVSQLTVSQWNEYSSLPVGGGSLGVLQTVNVTWANGTATTSTPQNPTTAAASQVPGLQQVGSFLNALSQTITWVRVAKVIVGGTLIVVGAAHLTGADNAVAKAARRIPLPL